SMWRCAVQRSRSKVLSASKRGLFLAIAALATCTAHAAAPVEQAATAHIPLCAGLTIVTAIGRPEGDYESIKRIESVTPDRVRIRYSAEVMEKDEFSDDPPELKHYLVYRSVRRADLASSTVYEQWFDDGIPEVIAGTTAIGTSTAVLQQLKSRGQ